ncbi:MAG: hypothetical protein V3R87_10185 [Dehalococcoidia bacterium]
MAFPTRVYADYGMEKKTGSTKYHSLGTLLELPDGREYKYALAGGTALTSGTIVAAKVPTGNHDMDLVTAVAAVGATSITVTLGGTAAAKDLYADGYIFTNDGTGEGQVYRVKGHDAIDSSGSGAINLADADKVAVALDTTTLCGLAPNPYSGVVITPQTVTNRTVGVPPTAIAADEYGWVQTKGLASVLISGTVVLGQHIRVAGATTDGAVMALDRSGSGEDEQELGIVMGVVSVTTDYGLVFLNID